MKKTFLAATLAASLIIGSITAAAAACSGPAVMHDFPGTSFNMSLGTNAGDGNCISNIGIVGNLPGFASAPTVNLGTIGGVATQTTLAAVLSALNSPFQAGGSIGNTSFGATQPTASLLNATVLGTGTFAVQLTGATNNINNISGTVSLPTGAGTAANQATIITALSTLNTTAGNPLAAQAASIIIGGVGVPSWAGGTLGAMANYGTSPGTVLVPGVNAFITNTPAVTLASTTITGTVAATLNTTPSLANGNGVVPTQGGSVLSATNGGFQNFLQGNAVLSASNPIFDKITDGTNVITVKAASIPAASTDTAMVVDQRPGTVVQTSPGTLANGSTFVKGTTSAMTGTSSTQIVALVSSKILYITRVSCKGDPANAVGTKVQIQDGSGGTVLDTLTVDANGGGEQATGPTPLFWTTSGNGLYAQNGTTAASVICTASGYSG